MSDSVKPEDHEYSLTDIRQEDDWKTTDVERPEEQKARAVAWNEDMKRREQLIAPRLLTSPPPANTTNPWSPTRWIWPSVSLWPLTPLPRCSSNLPMATESKRKLLTCKQLLRRPSVSESVSKQVKADGRPTTGESPPKSAPIHSTRSAPTPETPTCTAGKVRSRSRPTTATIRCDVMARSAWCPGHATSSTATARPSSGSATRGGWGCASSCTGRGSSRRS